MTIVSDIITDALRESNLLPLGAAPSPEQVTEGVRRLQAIVLSALGGEVGYNMEDWQLLGPGSILMPSALPLPTDEAASYTARPQTRLICNIEEEAAVKLDPMPQDGQRFSVVDAIGSFASFNLTLDGNGRRVGGGATVVLDEAWERREYFYRADLAAWVEIEGFAEDDELPLPVDFDDYFIISLAMRLNPRYGRPLSQESASRLTQQRDQLVDRYRQSRIHPNAGAAETAE